MTLVLVADPSPTQVGAHLVEAAAACGVEVVLCDTRRAYEGPALIRRAAWRLGGHRPWRLRSFGAEVVATVRRVRPRAVLATGLAPLDAEALEAIGRLGVARLNFLTDDPWNPAHQASWFLNALSRYDMVFTPRHAPEVQLRQTGVPRVEYLPFAYSPSAHRYDPPTTREESARFSCDVLLAGGADDDRVRLVTPVIRAGLRVALYGSYWDRHDVTRPHARGRLDAIELRRATSHATVCLGLVRRANRDGHAMRSFEVPAMRGCLLAEATDDHRALFGTAPDEMVYFTGGDDVVDQVRALVADPAARARVIASSHDRVVNGRHTYADRLSTILARVA